MLYLSSMQVDWVVIFVASLVNMVIGFFWYSKYLFGSVWSKLAHVHMEKRPKILGKVLIAFGFSLVIAYFLAFFQIQLGITTVTDGMLVGFFLWLGFVIPTHVSAVIWAKKPIKLFYINAGYWCLVFLVMGGIIAA